MRMIRDTRMEISAQTTIGIGNPVAASCRKPYPLFSYIPNEWTIPKQYHLDGLDIRFTLQYLFKE
jgi:hypothetical protein